MYTIRKANTDDVNFLSTVIIGAEKSMTGMLGLANIFEISEEELRNYLISMLEEEIDGCEYSISSFYVACFKEQPVAALGGWLEGYPDGMSSTLLKSNLIGITFPREIIIRAMPKLELIKPLQYKRELNAYQIEYAYISKKHRGIGLPQELMKTHLEHANELNQNVKKVQVQPFENNRAMIRVHESSGFNEVRRYASDNESILNYFPHNSKILMEKQI